MIISAIKFIKIKFITPWIISTVFPSRCLFPLFFCRKPKASAFFCRPPFTESYGILIRHKDDRVVAQPIKICPFLLIPVIWFCPIFFSIRYLIIFLFINKLFVLFVSNGKNINLIIVINYFLYFIITIEKLAFGY